MVANGVGRGCRAHTVLKYVLISLINRMLGISHCLSFQREVVSTRTQYTYQTQTVN